mgnify:CR=1 FL=1
MINTDFNTKNLEDRNVAESILDYILKNEIIESIEIDKMCSDRNANKTVVYQLLDECVDTKHYYGKKTLRLKSGSANFVYTGCWSGAEKREKRKIRIHNTITITASVVGAVIGGVTVYVLGNLLF